MNQPQRIEFSPGPARRGFRRLEGSVAVVTGGSFGIGLATARLLASEGAAIAIVARQDDRLAGARVELEALAGEDRCLAMSGDVRSEADVGSFFERVVERFGGFDVVVSNAGSHHGAAIEDTSLDDWSRMMETHAGGAFLVSRAAFRFWKGARRGGRLVFVASKAAVASTPKAAAYSAAKAAQFHLARCLAEEGGPFGIRVNTVLPDGVIRGTGIFSPEQRIAAANRHGVAPEALEHFYAQRNALKASITPEDVARAILFLACDESAVINGAGLTVDGGVPTGYLR